MITWKFTDIISHVGDTIEITEEDGTQVLIIIRYNDRDMTVEEIQNEILQTNKCGDIKQTRQNITRWTSAIQDALESLNK